MFYTSLFRFPSVPGAVAIPAPRALLLPPWAPTVVLLWLVQVVQRYACKLNYKVAIVAPRALLLTTWTPMAVS